MEGIILKKPKYMSKLYAVIFLCLGVVFFILACLAFLGILKPSAHSQVQSAVILGRVFGFLSTLYFVICAIFEISSRKKERLHNELITNGMKKIATVEKIFIQKRTQYGTKSPYRLCYTYTHQSKIYHQKSHLLWEKPNLNEGDFIDAYIDDLGNSTVEL